MIKAGIVGLGRMGVSHFAIANAHNDVNLIAACEPSGFVRSAFDKYSKVNCYKDFKEMVDKANLDAIIITTPTKFHFEMVHYALSAGLHVFVEKPLCLSPEEGKQLVDLADKYQLVNQVGYHNRFVGTFREAKRIIQNNMIGPIYHVLGEAYGPVVLKDKGGTWRSNTSEGGGCLYDYATHVVNLIQFLVGSPDSVSGTVLQSIFSKKVDDAVYSTLNYRNGLSGQLSVNWSDETYRKMATQITVIAKKGKIIADSQELKIYFKNSTHEESYEQGWNMRWVTDLSPDVYFYLRGEEYSAQLDYFFTCIKNGSLENINSFDSAHSTDTVVNLIKNNAANQ